MLSFSLSDFLYFPRRYCVTNICFFSFTNIITTTYMLLIQRSLLSSSLIPSSLQPRLIGNTFQYKWISTDDSLLLFQHGMCNVIIYGNIWSSVIMCRKEIYIILLLFMSRRVCIYKGGEAEWIKMSMSFIKVIRME